MSFIFIRFSYLTECKQLIVLMYNIKLQWQTSSTNQKYLVNIDDALQNSMSINIDTTYFFIISFKLPYEMFFIFTLLTILLLIPNM